MGAHCSQSAAHAAVQKASLGKAVAGASASPWAKDSMERGGEI